MAEIVSLVAGILLVGGVLLTVLVTEGITGRSLARSGAAQLVVGIVPGAVAAGMVLILQVDLVPDELERAGVPVVIVAISLIFVTLLIFQRRIR